MEHKRSPDFFVQQSRLNIQEIAVPSASAPASATAVPAEEAAAEVGHGHQYMHSCVKFTPLVGETQGEDDLQCHAEIV